MGWVNDKGGSAVQSFKKGGKVKKKKGALDRLGEKIASVLIGQDPKTGEIPKRKKKKGINLTDAEMKMTILGPLPTGKRKIYRKGGDVRPEKKADSLKSAWKRKRRKAAFKTLTKKDK